MTETIKKYPAGKRRIATYFGTVLNWEGTRVESTGLQYWIKGKAKNRDNGRKLKVKSEKFKVKEEFVWGAPASLVVYYKPALEEVGLFDEDFFAYLEDVDLSLRLRAAGWKTLYVPQAVSYHWGGATADRVRNLRYRLVARNWWFIILKHYSFGVFLRNFPAILVEQAKNILSVGGLVGILWVVKELLLKCPRILGRRKPIPVESCQ